MTLELNDYGLEFDTYVCYIALSWQIIVPSLIAVIAYKIYKRTRNNRTLGNCLPTNTSDGWDD